MGVSDSPSSPSVSRSRTQVSSASSAWSPILVSCTGAHAGASPRRPYKFRSLRNSATNDGAPRKQQGGERPCQGGAPKQGAHTIIWVCLCDTIKEVSIKGCGLHQGVKPLSPLWADSACVRRQHHWLVWKKQKKYVLWRMDKNKTEKDREFSCSVTESYPKQPVIKVSWWRNWSHAQGWQPCCVLCGVSTL